MRVFLENHVKKCAIIDNFAKNAKDKHALVKITLRVQVFCKRGTSKIERATYWRGKIQKSEHFCEHQNLGEDFW